jgi:hypothetical protein
MAGPLSRASADQMEVDGTLRLGCCKELNAERNKGNLHTTRPIRTRHEHSYLLMGLLLHRTTCPKSGAITKDFGFRSDFRLVFAYHIFTFDPDSHLPRPNRNLIYLGACIIAGLRLARQNKANVRVIAIGVAVGESIELAHLIYSRVFRRRWRRCIDALRLHALRL